MKVKIILSIIALILMSGAFGQTNSLIDSLEFVVKTANEDTIKVDTLNTLCSQYIYINDYENALQYADSALDLADEINYKKGKADAFTQYGIVYCEQGCFTEALENHFASLKIRKEIGDKNGIAATYNDIGLTYRKQGKYLEALNKYNSALKILEEIGIKDGIANAYSNLGLTYYKQGAYAESMVEYLRSLKIYEEIDDISGIANAYNWIGNINKEQANRVEAMKYYTIALKMREEIGDIKGIASTTENIGGIYLAYGNYPKAMEHFNIALKIHEETGNKFYLSHIYCNIGRLYKAQRNYSEAFINLQIALKLSEEVGRVNVIVWAKLALGDLYIDANNYLDARKLFVDAHSTAERYGNTEGLKNSHHALARLNRLEGNYKMASEHSRMHFIYRDSLVNASTYNKIALMKFQYETEKKDREMELLKKDNELQKQQLEKQRLIRNGVIAGAMFLVILGAFVLRSIQLRRKLEKQKTIAQERNRISADLHDDFGSSLSEIFLLSDIVTRETKSVEAKNAAMKIADNSRHLLEGLGEIIWALNSKNDYLESMVAYIRRYAAEYFENSTVILKVNTPVNLPRTHISAEHRRNTFYAVKEALHNIIKHAQATEAEMKIKLDKEVLSIIINDNGIGMPKGEMNRFGNGMINMQSRMTSIKGEFSLQNHKGTKVTLKLPVG